MTRPKVLATRPLFPAGQEILNAIERQNYAVLGRRPAISKVRKLCLVARAAMGKLSGRAL